MKFVLATALASIFASSAVARFGLGNPRSVSQTEKQRVRDIKAKIATDGNLDPKE